MNLTEHKIRFFDSLLWERDYYVNLIMYVNLLCNIKVLYYVLLCANSSYLKQKGPPMNQYTWEVQYPKVHLGIFFLVIIISSTDSINFQDIPMQTNGTDCGVFLCQVCIDMWLLPTRRINVC